MSEARTTDILEDQFGGTDKAPTAAPVTVNTTVGGIEIAAASATRKSITLQNCGTEPCIIRLGGDPSTAAYNFVLSDGTAARDGLGASITLDTWKGAIKGITAANSTVIAVLDILED